jgi:AcrR family transcriptional regulator
MMTDRSPDDSPRAAKRRETRARISDTAIGLFLAQGYDATTVDEIAAAAGISRRGFFHYFASKDDILLDLQAGLGAMIAAELQAGGAETSPLTALRTALIRLASRYPVDHMTAMDRLMRSSPAVMARKQASYVQHEATVVAALQALWPDPARQPALRIAAMIAIGALRLSLDALGRESGPRPLADILQENFAALESGL